MFFIHYHIFVKDLFNLETDLFHFTVSCVDLHRLNNLFKLNDFNDVILKKEVIYLRYGQDVLAGYLRRNGGILTEQRAECAQYFLRYVLRREEKGLSSALQRHMMDLDRVLSYRCLFHRYYCVAHLPFFCTDCKKRLGQEGQK